MKRHLFAWLAMLASTTSLANDPLAFASGSWFDPDRAGEGFVVQMIPDERAIVTWFTYPPEGETGAQAWLIGSGVIDGNQIVVTGMVRPVGGVFGPEFDPETVVREDWGSLEITFADCDTATANWSGPPAFGAGSMDLVRLSAIDDVECDPETASLPDRVVSGRSGPWYDPSHNGEGWMLEMLADGRMVVYWFTFDDQGRQAWLVGDAEVNGRTLWIEDMLITGGTRFGDAFRSEDVTLDSWGSFGFLFEDCSNAKMRYASIDARFGEGTLEPERVAQLVSSDCTQPPPVEPLGSGTWSLSTDMETAVTESASATAGGFVYTGGGIGTFSRFNRFEPASGSHVEMPDLPDPRHHPMMATDGQDIYVAGGYISKFGLDNPGNNFWRFDPEIAEWEILPDLPKPRAAGAALYMHGRVWIVGGVGPGIEMQSYDIGTGQWELFPGAGAASRNHLQAVAFENEIWWIAGRTDSADMTFDRVLIWNPVTRAWRDGPPLNHARAGLAARVVQGQIMVAGGEVIDTMPGQVIPSLEVFAPGAEGWVLGPDPLVAVHGTTGAVVNGEFLLMGGSDIAGELSQNRATQIFTPARP